MGRIFLFMVATLMSLPSFGQSVKYIISYDGVDPRLTLSDARTELASGRPYVGQIISFDQNSIPDGWLECNGDTLNISDYQDLFYVIGTTYGGTDTTFYLPNLASLIYNTDFNTFNIDITENYSLPIGEASFFWCKAVENITKGDVVYASGAVGNSGKIEVSKFIADGSIQEIYVVGVAAESISNGDFGVILLHGEIRGISTSSFSEGTVLYASPSSYGALTNIKPSAPNRKIPIAFVVNSHATNGSMYVRAYAQGYDLDDLHNVQITGVGSNNILRYNSGTSRWENSPYYNVITGLTNNYLPKWGTTGFENSLISSGSYVQFHSNVDFNNNYVEMPEEVYFYGTGLGSVGQVHMNVGGASEWAWVTDTLSGRAILNIPQHVKDKIPDSTHIVLESDYIKSRSSGNSYFDTLRVGYDYYNLLRDSIELVLPVFDTSQFKSDHYFNITFFGSDDNDSLFVYDVDSTSSKYIVGDDNGDVLGSTTVNNISSIIYFSDTIYYNSAASGYIYGTTYMSSDHARTPFRIPSENSPIHSFTLVWKPSEQKYYLL